MKTISNKNKLFKAETMLREYAFEIAKEDDALVRVYLLEGFYKLLDELDLYNTFKQFEDEALDQDYKLDEAYGY